MRHILARALHLGPEDEIAFKSEILDQGDVERAAMDCFVFALLELMISEKVINFFNLPRFRVGRLPAVGAF